MVKILYIYADKCTHCKSTLEMIERAILSGNIDCEIVKFHYDTPEAINIAMSKGLDSIPSFVIGGLAFNGNSSEKEVTDAIRRASKL